MKLRNYARFVFLNRQGLTKFWLACGLSFGLAACGSGGAGANSPGASSPTAQAGSQPAPLRIVSTPNPSVFPLLLAMAQNPNLPVSLVPVATGSDIVASFSAGKGDGLLSMTYTAAQDVANGSIPNLQLVSVNYWSGFWMLAPKSANITNFSQLTGEGVLVAGPTSGGKGGGPDLIFQAAAKRAGYGAANFNVCYLPVMEAAQMILQQQPMSSNPACNASFTQPPTAISLVEPSATGLVMDSVMSGGASGPIVKVIDYQNLFTGYTAWPQNQLPHGGVSFLSTVLNDPARQQNVKTLLTAYRAAADAIMAAKGNPLAMSQIANTLSTGIATYYGQYNLSIPASVISAALMSGDFVYRTDLTLPAIQTDLAAFLSELVGAAPPASFYNPQ